MMRKEIAFGEIDAVKDAYCTLFMSKMLLKDALVKIGQNVSVCVCEKV
jgi:acyl-[acyl carrier protein]--UDP-N-acetylglucosamine O-acyltransferase